MTGTDGVASGEDHSCVVYDAGELVVGPPEHAGDADTETSTDPDGDPLEIIEDAAFAAVDGAVVAVGPTEEVTREYPPENADEAIDAAGNAVVPGFVDPHTHAVFAGDRSDELEAKLRGKSYQDILEEGGGILRTVRATREADDERLLENLLSHLDAMLARGTTTVEVKSGYGLDVDTELRLLEVIDRADDAHPIDLVPTFMGAHAVPDDTGTEEYVDHVTDDQLPAVASQGIAEFCDVFCEAGVFDVEQSRRVLEAGRDVGLTPKVHAEEFTRLGGAQLAATLEAASADHLLHATAEDAAALREAGVVPVLLPGTAFGLGEEYADARTFLEAGAPVAIATDFNPNCHSRSMAFVQTLSCLEMEMTPAEALRGATSAAARALDLEDGTGTLRTGAPADALVLEAPSSAHVAYRFDTPAVDAVVKSGEVVRS
ncbi:imidazolonepropionase [Halobiforma nitratireducens]|uniref:Imidazolonepropionase n=1 Tax=Halobiforma nitratireducens JCM 10879 TaxID=1227454 RepID=M0LZZ7_9EURY|nr:imidazolonepropionase [Halobiforma nitratireducens]EMA38753.1 imidazolonepropionase [Halobiforma nitratireducens JCM 10879]